MDAAKTHLIDGEWRPGQGAGFSSVNPASNEIIWAGLAATPAQVEAAVSSARRAFEGWADQPLEVRVALLEAFRVQLEANKGDLAECISRETGKPRWETLTEVAAMIAKIGISVNAYHERTGERRGAVNGARTMLRHKPHGVVAVFGPFNFPGHLPNGHLVPALLAGNTVVFKPSELAPLVGEKMLDLWQAAGLPPGVINLLQGEADTGRALAGHPGIDGVFFTGSPATGRALHRRFAGHPGKILALELGGNNPLVVHGVGDPRAAAYHIVQSAFLSAGQRCTCARRLIVAHGEEGDRVVDALRRMMGRIRVGPYTQEPEPFMGPVINNRAAVRLLQAQDELNGRGGESLVPMRRPQADLPFLTPGLMDVTGIDKRPDEEYFGPFLQLIRVEDFDAAIREANNTAFGLAAGLLSDRAELYEIFYRRARAGIINWNRPLTGASSTAPFGGVGDSGNLRPSAFYAADYCAYPVASLEVERLQLPQAPTPGIDP
jgi:succinylglutamic semialdehyde dehydrogenase